MAPLNLSSRDATELTNKVYDLAIIMALFSFALILLLIPPTFWHARNRNIGATAFVSWLMLLLMFAFINALIWPSDDMATWFNGVGLCDVEVKLQVASQVALPASFACVLRALAGVMNVERATLVQTKAQRRRAYAMDLVCCIGLPLLQMTLHFIVQNRRYYIYGIAGCTPSVSTSWLTILLLMVPPALWTLYDAYLAVVILIRLYRYRLSFSAIIASSSTTKSRFIRLYALCILWILGNVPIQTYNMWVQGMRQTGTSFNWAAVHDPESWNDIVMVPSGGTVTFEHWVGLAAGIIVFLFFGFGREATMMYRSVLLAAGAGKFFPSLKEDRRTSIAATISSFSSRARMVFKLKSFSSSGKTDTMTTSTSDQSSPRKSAYLGPVGGLDTVREEDGGSKEDLQKR